YRVRAGLADQHAQGVSGGAPVAVLLLLLVLRGDLGGRERTESGAQSDGLGSLGVEQHQGGSEAAAGAGGGTGRAAQDLVGPLVVRGPEAYQYDRRAGYTPPGRT